MQVYNSILLTSLLFSGIAVHASQLDSKATKLHQSDFEVQLLSTESRSRSDCPEGDQSPLPGCGRRDKNITKGNGFNY